MPLPSPKKNQSQDEFIGECMSNSVMNKEFPKQKQRLSVCFNIYRRAKKRKDSTGEVINWDDYKNEQIVIIP